jgi:predicted dehydrogenase
VAGKDTLRVAVVGGGNIAQHHLRVLRDLPGMEVVALADADPQVLRESAGGCRQNHGADRDHCRHRRGGAGLSGVLR